MQVLLINGVRTDSRLLNKNSAKYNQISLHESILLEEINKVIYFLFWIKVVIQTVKNKVLPSAFVFPASLISFSR